MFASPTSDDVKGLLFSAYGPFQRMFHEVRFGMKMCH